MKTTQQITQEAFAEYQGKLAAYRKAITTNDLAKTEKALSELKESEQRYAEVKKKFVFNGLSQEAQPILSAIVMRRYGVVSHKLIKENGVTTGVEEAMKYKRIDLVELSRYCKLPVNWSYKLDRLGQLLALRIAQEQAKKGDKHAQEVIGKIKTSYFMKEVARNIDLGATPTSNTQLLKLLQSIVDDMCFIDNGEGQNKIRLFNQDIKAFVMAFTEFKKSAENADPTFRFAQSSTLRAVFIDVLYMAVTGRGCNFEFKTSNKTSGADAPEASKQAVA